MRVARVLLLVAAVAGALSATAAFFAAWRESLQCGVVALGSLSGYAAWRGSAASPLVRWALAAGVALLATAMAVQVFWHRGQSTEFGWFQYGPSSEAYAAVLRQWRQKIDAARIVSLIHLGGVVCLGVAVRAVPQAGRRRPGWPAVPMMCTVALLAVVGANLWSRLDDDRLLGLLAATWPALLATMTGLAVAGLAGWRAEGTWLLPAGALLLAGATAVTLDDLAASWSSWSALADPSPVVAARSASTSGGIGLDVSPALTTAAALGGPALLVLGALRAGPADPES